MMKCGIIYSVDLDERIISLNEMKGISFYYISNGLMKKFRKYLYKGNYISFTFDNVKEVKGKYFCYKIDSFLEISVPRRFGKDILYSKKDTSELLCEFLDSLDNLLFIDIEMSMPGYKDSKDFVSEIIQTGFFVVNKNGEIIEKYNYHIKPNINNYLSDRTVDFLHINYNDLKRIGVDYMEFYNKFKELIINYNPAVVVFGKNDKLFLNSSYIVNNVESLTPLTRFVNLNQLIKNFYDLSKDPGLFNMYEKLYGINLKEQAHDALEDSLITYEVYKGFYNDVKKYVNELALRRV